MKRKKKDTTEQRVPLKHIKKSPVPIEKTRDMSGLDYIGHTQATTINSVIDDLQNFRPSHECSYCLMTFTKVRVRKDHENSQHIKDLKYECHKCPKKFYTNTSRWAHVHRHSISKLFECPQCPLHFSAQFLLNIHFKWAHAEKIHECVACDVRFSFKSKLMRHFKTKKHIKTTGNSTNNSILSIEKFSTEMEKTFKCKTCSKSYTTKDTLKRHQEKWGHTTKKGSVLIPQMGLPVNKVVPVTLRSDKVSPKINSDKSLRLRKEPKEENVESQQLAFACTTCSKSYKTKERLNRHGQRRGHLIKRKSKVVSEICPVDDAVRSDVPRQEEKVKKQVSGESFGCLTCPNSYKTRARLERHWARRGHDARGHRLLQYSKSNS